MPNAIRKDANPKSIQCKFCVDFTGAIIKSRYKGKDTWCHITCVNWFDELWFSDDENKKEVIGTINEDRKGMYCQGCKDRSRRGYLL